MKKNILITTLLVFISLPIHAETTNAIAGTATGAVKAGGGAGAGTSVSSSLCPYSDLETDDGSNLLIDGVEPVYTVPSVDSFRRFSWGTLFIKSRLVNRNGSQRVKLSLRYQCAGTTSIVNVDRQFSAGDAKLSQDTNIVCGFGRVAKDPSKDFDRTKINARVANAWCSVDEEKVRSGHIVLSVLQEEQTGTVDNAGRCVKPGDIDFTVKCANTTPAQPTQSTPAPQPAPAQDNQDG